MSFPGKVVRDDILPPNWEMKVLAAEAQSAAYLAGVNPENTLSQPQRQCCGDFITRLITPLNENTGPLVSLDKPYTEFEENVAMRVGHEGLDETHVSIWRAIGVLMLLEEEIKVPRQFANEAHEIVQAMHQTFVSYGDQPLERRVAVYCEQQAVA